MFRGLDFEVDLADDASGIDQESVSRGELAHHEVHQRIIGRGQSLFSVRQKFEAEAFLGAKLLVRILVLNADSEDDRILLFILSEVALKVVRFDGAAAGEVFRIEIEHDPLAFEIAKADGLAVLRIHGEVRRGGACESCSFPGLHGTNGDDYEEQHNHTNQNSRDLHHRSLFFLAEAAEAQAELNGVDAGIQIGHSRVRNVHEAHFRADIVFATQEVHAQSAAGGEIDL